MTATTRAKPNFTKRINVAEIEQRKTLVVEACLMLTYDDLLPLLGDMILDRPDLKLKPLMELAHKLDRQAWAYMDPTQGTST